MPTQKSHTIKMLSQELSILGLDTVTSSISYGELGEFVPDADLIVYDSTYHILSLVIVGENIFPEGVPNGGYWKMKLASNPKTAHIKVYLIVELKSQYQLIELEADGAYKVREVSNGEALFSTFASHLVP